jgi:hypothetical protein
MVGCTDDDDDEPMGGESKAGVDLVYTWGPPRRMREGGSFRGRSGVRGLAWTGWDGMGWVCKLLSRSAPAGRRAPLMMLIAGEHDDGSEAIDRCWKSLDRRPVLGSIGFGKSVDGHARTHTQMPCHPR